MSHDRTSQGTREWIGNFRMQYDSATSGLRKVATGIDGFDEVSRGGLPAGRTTLLEGGPGSGKTVFALQQLVHGAKNCGEPGIFVAFEESSSRILENFASFGWDLHALQEQHLYLLDVQPDYESVIAGDFDLCGMLAALSAKVDSMGVKRVVFDAIDVVLSRIEDPGKIRREMYRLHNWLLDRGLTAIITYKFTSLETSPIVGQLDLMRFMFDCSIMLEHTQKSGVSRRNLRIAKYRGAGFEEDNVPFVIGDTGIEVGYTRAKEAIEKPTTSERLSSGIEAMDKMLGGGYLRGASILITGVPGTAKTTLSGAFAQAACERGERVLFVTFDSEGHEIVRNLASVNINLATHEASGLLSLYSARTFRGNSEVHLMRITKAAEAFGAQCMIMDPLSALGRVDDEGAFSLAERLITWAKGQGITMLCTSLIEGNSPLNEGTEIKISTIADTWLHLSYVINSGERNRCLTIVKSRGTAHSNQVRELLLHSTGVTLADVFVEGGEVLTGTLRFEKEQEEQRRRELRALERARKNMLQDIEISKLSHQLEMIKLELEQRTRERESFENENAAETAREAQTRSETVRRRGGDGEGYSSQGGAS